LGAQHQLFICNHTEFHKITPVFHQKAVLAVSFIEKLKALVLPFSFTHKTENHNQTFPALIVHPNSALLSPHPGHFL
jgi:hypothetical protein